MEALRIEIAGEWTAIEMGRIFLACDEIYRSLATFHSRELQRQINQEINHPTAVGNSDGRGNLLKVYAVSFSSPGWIDLLGHGEIVGHLKDLLLGLIDRVAGRKDRALQRELTAAAIDAAILENQAKMLDNLDKAFDLTERTDLNDVQRQSLLTALVNAQRNVANQITVGRVVGIKGREIK